jgi:hypothetical protein
LTTISRVLTAVAAVGLASLAVFTVLALRFDEPLQWASVTAAAVWAFAGLGGLLWVRLISADDAELGEVDA